MRTRNLYVPLPEQAVERLRSLAEREFRGTKQQAAWLILEGLRRTDPEQAAGSRKDEVRT